MNEGTFRFSGSRTGPHVYGEGESELQGGAPSPPARETSSPPTLLFPLDLTFLNPHWWKKYFAEYISLLGLDSSRFLAFGPKQIRMDPNEPFNMAIVASSIAHSPTVSAAFTER
jgi:hypothetical protein